MELIVKQDGGWLVLFAFHYFRNKDCYQKFNIGYYNYSKGSYR